MHANDSQGKVDDLVAKTPKAQTGQLGQSSPIPDLSARFEEYASAKDAQIAALVESQRFLQKLLIGIIAAAIVMGLGTSVFFIKQMRLVRQQLELQRAGTSESLRDFNVRIEPEIHRFAGELQAFSATNTDFRPVLEYFQPRLSRYFSTLAPSAPPQAATSGEKPPSEIP